MITDFIEKLRKKPESTRALIVWISTAIVMVVVVLVWLASMSRQGWVPFSPDSSERIGSVQEGRLNKISEFFNEAKGDFLYLKDDLSKTMGDFFAGKNEPKEIPPELQEYLPEEVILNPPLILPKTD
jgi:hypothetical protein